MQRTHFRAVVLVASVRAVAVPVANESLGNAAVVRTTRELALVTGGLLRVKGGEGGG